MLKTDIFGINLLPYNKITSRTEILTYLFAFKADGMVIAVMLIPLLIN
jgi:hypothetical protein